MEYWQLEDPKPPAKRHQGSLVFTLKEMEKATCSFSDDNFLGKGGFGRVYKGILQSGEVEFTLPAPCSKKTTNLQRCSFHCRSIINNACLAQIKKLYPVHI